MSLLFLVLIFMNCTTADEEAVSESTKPETEASFDEKKWKTKHDLDYPYRDEMVNSVLYNDTIRSLSKQQIIKVLGEPDRTNEGYLYYQVSQSRFGPWPLKTKTLVFKFLDDDSIDWIKLHE